MDRTKSRTDRHSLVRVSSMALALVAGLNACGGGPSTSTTPAPAPTPTVAPSAPVVGPAGDVERATFAASLGVDLTKMVRRPSGLYVQDMTTGDGSVAARDRTAVLRYSGFLANGTQFDSGEITITLGKNQVIRAWEDGVLGMRVNGKRRIVTPPHLAYGSRGAPPAIPPNAVLVFDMELRQVY